MDLQLNGKSALVTGSSKGIGEAIALTLAREGAKVLVHGRDRVKVDAIVGTVAAQGGTAFGVIADLTDDDEVTAMIATATDCVGRIDILVNNAGGSGPKRVWDEANPREWAASYDRNMLAALRVTNGVLPAMRRAGWGRVIHISSVAATVPPPAGADYSAAKAAINAMTASLAKAVAVEGVTVNAISPGTIRSARLEEAFRSVASDRGLKPGADWRDIEAVALPLFAQVPVGRVGELQELADAVAFLASPLASYITGVELRVDGGLAPML